MQARDWPRVDVSVHQRDERLALHEFHGDKRQPVFRLADVVNDANVRMIERRSGSGLIEKALSPLRVRGHFARQELDRRFAFQAGVFGQEDFPHTALAQKGNDAVGADPAARRDDW